MKKLLITGLVALLMPATGDLIGQQEAKVTETASAAPKKESKQDGVKLGPGSSSKAKGMDLNAGVTGPIITEIYADESFFDSNKSVGIFRGRVKVNDPRFNLQSDKLTAFISKGQNQGLEKAVAEGNVAVVRDRPDPNGGPPTHAVGRAETATYIAATGDVELKGMPRVQQGLNTHIGTSSETVMVINQNGQLTTHGPSRTDIRQEPKGDNATGQKADSKSAEKEEKKSGAKDERKSPEPSPKS